jgi:hypothetical protein
LDRAAPRGWTNDPVLNATWFRHGSGARYNLHQARRAASLATAGRLLVVRPTDVKTHAPGTQERRAGSPCKPVSDELRTNLRQNQLHLPAEKEF